MREEVIAETLYCVQCAHLEEDEIMFMCDAYPSGIPEDILLGHRTHTEVLPDQQGKVVFKKINFFR